jgi:hypothetical protein
MELSPKGQLLRNGLLHVVDALHFRSLLERDDEENYEGPLMDALGDVLEALHGDARLEGAVQVMDTEDSMRFANEAFTALVKHISILEILISHRQASYLDVSALCAHRQLAAWSLSTCGSILGALNIAQSLTSELQELAPYDEAPSLGLVSSACKNSVTRSSMTINVGLNPFNVVAKRP